MKKIDKNFVSEIDKKLAAFDSTHEKSASQQAEIAKFERIYRLRDNKQAEPKKETDKIWEDF